MKKILVNEKVSKDALDILEKVGEVVYMPQGGLEDFTRLVKDVTAVMMDTTINFTPELMDTSPQLEVISRTGTGVDNINIEAATKRGILVLHTPDANTISVAEHTLALMGAITKHLLFLDTETRKGNFKTVRRLYKPIDLDGKILGIIGYGRIGRAVAKKCMAAFNMKVIIYDPYVSDSDIDHDIIRCNLEEQVYREADILSLHIPLTGETKNHVNESKLSLMKPTAYLINTARGSLVDETYLAKMLREDRLAGVAFDVMSKEPPELNDDLMSAPNLIITPHSAPLTAECTVRVACEAANGIADYFEGRTPKFIYNKEGLKKR